MGASWQRNGSAWNWTSCCRLLAPALIERTLTKPSRCASHARRRTLALWEHRLLCGDATRLADVDHAFGAGHLAHIAALLVRFMPSFLNPKLSPRTKRFYSRWGD